MANFPDDFLWGTATAAHQVEGGNTSTPTFGCWKHGGPAFQEPWADACDHYHRYPQDIALLNSSASTPIASRSSGRASSRRRGASRLPHSTTIGACWRCLKNGVMHGHVPPLHLTALVPGDGGWENKNNVDRFLRYCERAVNHTRRPDRHRLHDQRGKHPDHGDDDARSRRRRGRRWTAGESA